MTEDVFTLARAAATRLRWEGETGALGTVPPGSVSLPEVKPRVNVEAQAPAPSMPQEPAQRPSDIVKRSEEPVLAPATDDKAGALRALREEIGDCRRCGLHSGRTKLVFGDGDPEARLVFVGEGPGRDEDMSGLPFVGAAGRLLTKIIAAIGLDRSQVFICNIVKCRPPNNRDPLPEETAVCGPFVRRQLEIIRPEVVVCLGRPSAQFILGTDAPMGRLRGRFHMVGETAVMPTYHPAYLLRNESAKRPVWEDMKMVRDRLGLQAGGKP